MLTECVGNLKTPAGRKLPTDGSEDAVCPVCFPSGRGGQNGVKVGEVVLPDLLGSIQSPFVSQKSSS